MSDRVRIAFIGCGGNARGHMGRLVKMDSAQLVAVCDVVEDLAQSAASEHAAKAYTDHRAMLDGEQVDCVYLSIPVFAHGAPESDVIKRKLPFFVEKPVAIDLATAKEIETKVAESGVITCVGYQLRYCGSTDLARAALTNATLNMIIGKYWCGTGHGDPTRWLRVFSKSGGQIVEQATHTIDLMRYLGGEVEEVFCHQTQRILKETDCPDQNIVSMKFRDGGLGCLTATWAYDARDWNNANRLDILFDTKLLQWSANGIRLSGGGEPPEDENQPGLTIDEVFIDAVARNDASLIRSPYEDAVKSLAVSLAANESARTGQPVKVQ